MLIINFDKYQGLGNDFVILDAIKNINYKSIHHLNNGLIELICNRKLGVGADGVLILSYSYDTNQYQMRIFNPDGSEPEMCGNGIRCIMQYLINNKYTKSDDIVEIKTLAGTIECKYIENNIQVNMGKPSFHPKEIPCTLELDEIKIPNGLTEIDKRNFKIYGVGMGNPHLVTYVTDLANFDSGKFGPILENSEYFPSKTNVHFVQIINRKNLNVIVWERGAGFTQACGTGACAVLAVSRLLKKCDSIANIHLPGGILNINWPNINSDIFMTGPSKYVFSGNIKLGKYN